MTERKAIEIERKTDEWYAECECFPQSGDAFTTVSGMPIKRLYTPVEIAATRYSDDIGFPGEYPFTPGVHYTGYRGRTLTMRMCSLVMLRPIVQSNWKGGYCGYNSKRYQGRYWGLCGAFF